MGETAQLCMVVPVYMVSDVSVGASTKKVGGWWGRGRCPGRVEGSCLYIQRGGWGRVCENTQKCHPRPEG